MDARLLSIDTVETKNNAIMLNFSIIVVIFRERFAFNWIKIRIFLRQGIQRFQGAVRFQ